MSHMSDFCPSARAKIKRAFDHINEINKILSEKRPFRYTLETDAKAGWRSIGVKKDQAIVDEIAVICGDAVHNLRSALDHAYGAVVSRFAVDDRERKAVQFPFSETAARLEEAVRNRLAHRVSPKFFETIMALRPYGEDGGNRILYLLHVLDIPDKHSAFVPTADYTKISAERIRELVPDFPTWFSGLMSFSDNGRDIAWQCRRLNMGEWIVLRVSPSGILEQEINIPVDVTFKGVGNQDLMPVVPALHQFADATTKVYKIISRFV